MNKRTTPWKILAIAFLAAGVAGMARGAEIHSYGFEDGAGSSVVADSTGGNEGNGYPGDDAILGVPGKFGDGVAFGGSRDGYVALDFGEAKVNEIVQGTGTVMFWAKQGDQTNPLPPPDDFEAWIYRVGGAVGDSGQLIVIRQDDSVAVESRVYDPGGSLEWVSGTVGRICAPEPNAPAGSAPEGEWTHIAFAYENTRLALYVNGSEAFACADSSNTFELNPSTGPIYFGSSAQNYSRVWNGVLDEVKIFDEFLDEAGVQAVMNVPVPPPPVPPPPAPMELLHYFPFDEGDGVTVTDVVRGAVGTFAPSGTINWVPGRNGTGLEFNMDSFVTMGNDTTFELNRGGSIMAWIKPEMISAFPDENQHLEGSIFRKGSDGSRFSILMMYAIQSQAATVMELSTTDGPKRVVAGGDPPREVGPLDGDWSHVAVTVDPDLGANFYVNGEKAGATVRFGRGILDSAGIFSVGGDHAHPNSATRHFDGIIDELKIFSNALTEEQVMAEMSNFNVLTTVPVNISIAETVSATVDARGARKYRLGESGNLVASAPAAPGGQASDSQAAPLILHDVDGPDQSSEFYGASEEVIP